MEPHPYGWLSLLPPVVAIALAIATRRIVLSLIVGIFAGAIIMANGNPFVAIGETWERHIWATAIDSGKLRMFSFTVFMGAMVGVITRSGGMKGLVEVIMPYANTRGRGQIATWILGLLVFFDDYANTLLVGSTMQGIFDRLKISREKLAYIVDSTAAPVAALAPLSTWVAVEIDAIAEGLARLPDSEFGAFSVFLTSIPYRFYPWMALLLVPLTALLGRDLPLMAKAEKSSLDSTDDYSIAGKSDMTLEGSASWIHAAFPILATLFTAIYLIYSTGAAACVGQEDVKLRDILGEADTSLALQYGALIGLCLAIIMAWIGKLMSFDKALQSAYDGAKLVLPAVAILCTAAALSRMTTDKSVEGEKTTTAYQFKDHRMYTAAYLTPILTGEPGDAEDGTEARSGLITVKYLPTVVFILAAIVAFCTGTSWGTMLILMPMVVQTCHTLLTAAGTEFTAGDPILNCSIGGVLAGAVFGDHCSPISDTTVLSSQSSGCSHLAHVWTQLPYAFLAGVVSVVLGTIPIGFGYSIWLILPVQCVVLVLLLWILGRKVAT